MDLITPIPEANSRSVFVGMTGCGKTTLAREIVTRYYPWVVVYDIKGQMKPSEWKGFTFYKKFDRLIKANPKKEPWLVYQPNIYEIPDESDWTYADKFFKWIYLRKKTCVYIDEVYGCTSRAFIPFYFKAILTRGRERGITCMMSTQRPAEIPQFILSESENWFVFRLQMPQDKKKIEEIKGFPVGVQEELTKHQFLVGNETGVSLQPRKLKF